MNRIKYLFLTVLSALVFTGCSKDDDSLGSLGEMSVSQTYVSIPSTGGQAKVTINANQPWKMKDLIVNESTGKTQYLSGTDKNTGEPVYKDLWCSISKLSGEAGESEITFTAPASDGGHETEIVIEVGNTRQHLKVRQGTFDPETVTCAYFNEQGLDGKNYRVSGTVTAIANTTYGNMYVNDGTGEVYVYGTLDKDGAEKNFSSLGIEIGDVITIEGPRSTYGTTIEMVNVTVVKIVKSLIKIDGAAETKGISKDGGEISVKVAYKGSGAYFSIPEDSKAMVEYKSSKFIAGVPTKLEKNPADTCVFTFNVMPNDGAARSGSIVFTSSTSNNSSEVTYSFSQEGAIAPVTCAEFNAKPVGDAQYRIIGLVTKVANTKYGNIYVQDYTGEVYVYGTTNYSDFPVKEGDVVNIVGPHAEYKGNPQMTNATIDELCASAESISLADFNAAADDNNKLYVLTGKITEIANDKYGNVYIEDENGEKVYLYGVYGDWTGENKQYFIKDNGIAVGDTITVVTIKTSHKDSPQGKNAVCFGVEKAD